MSDSHDITSTNSKTRKLIDEFNSKKVLFENTITDLKNFYPSPINFDKKTHKIKY